MRHKIRVTRAPELQATHLPAAYSGRGPVSPCLLLPVDFL